VFLKCLSCFSSNKTPPKEQQLNNPNRQDSHCELKFPETNLDFLQNSGDFPGKNNLFFFKRKSHPGESHLYLKAFELGEMEPGRYADCIFNVILVRKPNVETTPVDRF